MSKQDFTNDLVAEGDEMTEQTLGQKRVRLDFNPSGDQTVNDIKAGTAMLIDSCEELKKYGKNPRLVALAQTAYEEACMWAVKAATA